MFALGLEGLWQFYRYSDSFESAQRSPILGTQMIVSKNKNNNFGLGSIVKLVSPNSALVVLFLISYQWGFGDTKFQFQFPN